MGNPNWKYKIWECYTCGEAENFVNPCIWKNPLNSDEPGFCPLGGDKVEWEKKDDEILNYKDGKMEPVEVMNLFVKEYCGMDYDVIESWRIIRKELAEVKRKLENAARWDELNPNKHGLNPFLKGGE